MRAFLITLLAVSAASAQGNFKVAEDDIPKLKLNHYFTPDKKNHQPDFAWTFTKTEFTIKKGKGAIPKHVVEKMLPDGMSADEITGKWTLKDGKLELTEIKADGKAIKKDASMSVAKTAPTVVRIMDPSQIVFSVE